MPSFLSFLLYLYLNFNFNNGAILELSDGSRWAISPDNIAITSVWLVPMEIDIKDSGNKDYPYLLINNQTHQQVKAKKEVVTP